MKKTILIFGLGLIFNAACFVFGRTPFKPVDRAVCINAGRFEVDCNRGRLVIVSEFAVYDSKGAIK